MHLMSHITRAVSWATQFYMSISKRPIAIIIGDNNNSISFLYRINAFEFEMFHNTKCTYIHFS